MTENKVNIDEMIDFLHKGNVVVSFTKKNGEKRLMTCTLNLSEVPEEKHPKVIREYDHKTFVKAFDVNKQDWRTITLANVESFEVA